jgi:hypothetical protein
MAGGLTQKEMIVFKNFGPAIFLNDRHITLRFIDDVLILFKHIIFIFRFNIYHR